MADFQEILRRHSDKEFVQRILNPDPDLTIDNGDGSRSTHRMAAEVDSQGNWFVFPTIVNQDGRLVEMPNNDEAFRYNAERGEVIPFGKDKDAAINFSINYKPKSFERQIDRFRRGANTYQSELRKLP